MRPMMEDRVLIWRFQRGSKDALRRVYEKYRHDLLKLAIQVHNQSLSSSDMLLDAELSAALLVVIPIPMNIGIGIRRSSGMLLRAHYERARILLPTLRTDP